MMAKTMKTSPKTLQYTRVHSPYQKYTYNNMPCLLLPVNNTDINKIKLVQNINNTISSQKFPRQIQLSMKMLIVPGHTGLRLAVCAFSELKIIINFTLNVIKSLLIRQHQHTQTRTQV